MNRPIALITGASVGIGSAFARLLAELGHDLVLVARDRQRLEALAKELEAGHEISVEVLAADLTVGPELANVEARCADAARPVDVLINNAGFGSFGRFHELDVDTETREIQLNVLALVRLTHAAARTMAPRGSGGILNVSSLAGFQPGPFNAVYAASKAFVTSFTESVHEELKGSGVHVTALCPGFTRTEFQERANAPAHRVPGFLWQSADDVARTGLKGLDKNHALVVSGGVNRVSAVLSSMTPHAVTRRASAFVVGRNAN
jgi:short-subunit dehydrogenase